MRKEKRPSKLDRLAQSFAQDNAHRGTEDIIRERTVLACEQNTVDQEILSLSMRLADARDRRAKVEAKLRGLAQVVEKR